MGYTTSFTGILKFTNDPSASQLRTLQVFLGADCREHPEWGNTELSYIDLKLTSDLLGLEWDGSEKTYDLTEKVNLVIEQMRKSYKDFGLVGTLQAQGEDFTDRWVLVVENNKATKMDVKIPGTRIKCPHCDSEMFLQDDGSIIAGED